MQENNTVFCKYGKGKVKILTEKANISHKTRESEEKSPGYLVFVSATLLICLPFKKIV